MGIIKSGAMSFSEKNLDVMQNLEAVIADLSRKNPAITDYVALRGYEGVFQYYRAELRGHAAKKPELNGLDAAAFEALREICEFRLGRNALMAPDAGEIKPISVEELQDCLRQLIKSVERHTRIEGRMGYLSFIKRFV
jgi:hypothetical protein